MEPAVLAERARLFNSLEKLEKRIRKAEARKHGIQVEQLQNLLDTFFPNGYRPGAPRQFSEFLSRQSQLHRDPVGKLLIRWISSLIFWKSDA